MFFFLQRLYLTPFLVGEVALNSGFVRAEPGSTCRPFVKARFRKLTPVAPQAAGIPAGFLRSHFSAEVGLDRAFLGVVRKKDDFLPPRPSSPSPVWGAASACSTSPHLGSSRAV